MNLIFDGNYLYHKTFNIFQNYYKEPVEEILTDPDKQQVLIRKCVIELCYTVRRFAPVDKVVVVIDSKSWRYVLYDNYKYALTRVKEGYYEHFLRVLDMLEQLLRKKGVIVSRVNGAEGDDLIYVWSLYYGYCLGEETVIVTGDSDIRQIITENVSVYNSNSKNLKLYCIHQKEVGWNERMDTDVQVVPTDAFEVLLYKVIIGDKSDNIPQLKKGFGEKTFSKFIASITPYRAPQNVDLVTMAQWIATRFSSFTGMKYEDVLGKVLFNLKMVWLNLSVYNCKDYYTVSGKSLLENMLDDVLRQKDTYSYDGEWSLEHFYGALIK